MAIPWVTAQFFENGVEVPPRMEGPFLWMCPYLLKVKKQVVHHPRSPLRLALSRQTSQPLHEDCSVRIFEGHNLECRFTFKSVDEGKEFYATAVSKYEGGRKEAAKKVAPTSPEKGTTVEANVQRRRKRPVDEAFEHMSMQGKQELTKFSASKVTEKTSSVTRADHEVDSLSAKRRAIDSRTTTSPERSSIMRQSSRMPQRAPAPPSSILQRRPSNPPQDSSIYGGYRPALAFGLRNLGNTCYLNAVTQAIGSLREFVEDLRGMPNQLPGAGEGALFKCTVEILKKMQETTNFALALSPAKLREQIAIAAPMFQGNGQQDAHEFFLEYMNQLHDELLTAHKAHCQAFVAGGQGEVPVLATQSHFDAEVQRQLTCVQCGQARTVSERFRDFSLDFSGGTHVEQLPAMLRRYFQPELLEATCEHCNAVEANLDTNLTEAPRVLALHLKRFVPNMEKQRYEKQHQAVDIPSLLDLGATLSGNAAGASPPRLPARPLAPLAIAPDSPETKASVQLRYGLRAVVAHEGASPRAGHYVCYAKSASGEWRLYDDSRVTRLADGEEPQDLGRKAYMLFYVLNSELPAN